MGNVMPPTLMKGDPCSARTYGVEQEIPFPGKLGLKASEKLANLYGSAIVPQSNLALNSAIANYQAGKIDFLKLIDASMSLLESQLKYYESMVEFHKALAKLGAACRCRSY